jgi:hypothetical protein
MLSYILHGADEQLLLHQDYLTLRVRKGTPIFCCCCEVAADHSDYVMLLKVRVLALGHRPVP